MLYLHFQTALPVEEGNRGQRAAKSFEKPGLEATGKPQIAFSQAY
jgi:hypothetical protein